MDIKDFPRPQSDTGLGVQWSAGYAAALGLGPIEERWIPLLHALGIAWVSFRYEGGLEFARLLQANGLTPIVQLGAPYTLPGRLPAETLEAVKAYAAAGARYFELAEPLDAPTSWRSGRRPADVIAQSGPQLMADLEAILQMGGLPGLPACQDAELAGALLAAIGEAGHEDWLKDGVWLAHRVQAGNLPLDYPNDLTTLQGKPLTEEDYRRRSAEAWDGSVWNGHTRDEINALRMERRDLQAQLQDKPAGWRRHELLDAAARRVLGRSLPVLATAGGCSIGETTDARYPSVSPMGHGARTLEMARIMMGTSKLYPAAPGYFFCTAFSLLGNYALGHFEPRWEPQAWFSPRLPGGQLPIVDMLREEPKRQRWGERGAALRFTDAGAFDMAPSLSTIFAPLAEASAADGVRAPAPAAPWPPAAVVGRLAGGAGQSLTLESVDSDYSATQTVGDDGSFAFRGLRAGAYRLSVIGSALTLGDLAITSGEERLVPLAMPAWHWRITTGERELPFSILRCSVEGRPDVAVTLCSPTAGGPAGCMTGVHKGAPALVEFAPLTAGRYVLEPAGLDVRIEVELDGHSALLVEIIPTQAVEEPLLPAPPLPTDKGIQRYLLLARPFTSQEDLLAVLRFMNVHQPACGFSVAEAQWAREVIIIGAGDLRVSEEDERLLRESGCRIMRIEERVAETLKQLSNVGDPFANYRTTQ